MGNTNLLNVRGLIAMRIWIIDHYAVPERYNPLIRQTIFARKLMERGYQVRIFSASTVHNSDINLIDGTDLYREEFADGVNYTYVKCHGYKGNGLKRIINMEEFAYKLPKVCNEYVKIEGKPEVILACSMTLQACKKGIQIARQYNAKPIAQISDLWPESIVAYGKASKYNPLIWILRNIERWIYTHADKIIFTMEGAYDYILERKWDKEIPYEKITIINNGVDINQFNYNREHYLIKDEDLENDSIFKVVYTGSIRAVNNLGLLLDVAKEIKDKDIRFLIWGDGDELSKLKKRVYEEEIENVIFKGKVEKKYIPYITSHADLNMAHNNPSELFRFGISFNKIFDYLAAGKPVMTDFPCCYNPVVKCKAGVAVDNSNVNEIANAICQVKKMDCAMYLSLCNGARKGAEMYSFDYLTEKLCDTIREM